MTNFELARLFTSYALVACNLKKTGKNRYAAMGVAKP